MDNHSWLNRESKIFWISHWKLKSNLQGIWNKLGQRAATKLSAATGSVLSKAQQTFISSIFFQLLVAMAVNPSNWISFAPELPANYLTGDLIDLATLLWPTAQFLLPLIHSFLNYHKLLRSHSRWSRGSSDFISSFIPRLPILFPSG